MTFSASIQSVFDRHDEACYSLLIQDGRVGSMSHWFQVRDEFVQKNSVDRLYEMPVNSRLASAGAVGLLAPSCDSRHSHAFATGRCPDALRRLDAVEAGHAKVHKNQVEFVNLGDLDCLQSAVGY